MFMCVCFTLTHVKAMKDSRLFYSSHTQLYRIQSVVKCKSGPLNGQCKICNTTQEDKHKYRSKTKN